MAEINLPYLQIYQDRQGRIRIYYRRNGKRTALPSDVTSAEFLMAYAEVHDQAESDPARQRKKAKTIEPLSFAALIRTYKASPEYHRLAASTRAEYDRVLNIIEQEDGHRLPRDIRRKDVRKRRDARADKPGAANTYLGVLSMLIGWGINADFDPALTTNACTGVRKFTGGSYRAWLPEEKTAFETRWPIGSKQRLAYALARYTGQRRGDLVTMTRAHIGNGLIQVTQQKTAAPLWIPMHKELVAAISALPATDMLLLVNENSTGFDPVYFGAWFADAIDEAKLPDDCVLHGLRHSAASDLAEAGCSEPEIKSILGHKTTRMVEKYTAGARQIELAKSAIRKLEANRKNDK